MMADHEIHARLVVHNFEDMPQNERKRLVNWLHKLAHEFRHPPKEGYASKFTARLHK